MEIARINIKREKVFIRQCIKNSKPYFLNFLIPSRMEEIVRHESRVPPIGIFAVRAYDQHSRVI